VLVDRKNWPDVSGISLHYFFLLTSLVNREALGGCTHLVPTQARGMVRRRASLATVTGCIKLANSCLVDGSLQCD
jgi:hypothetical protein